MEIIDIKDYFKISDDHSEVRGFIEVKDNDGNTIFVKENMITERGRQYIKNKIATSLFKDNIVDDSKLDPNIRFYGMLFGKNGSITTPDMEKLIEPVPSELNGQNDDDKLFFKIGGKNNSYAAYTLTSKIDKERVIQFQLSINTTVDTTVPILREAGLFLSDKSMFSRVAFAPLTLKSGNSYTINYYIYF